jgi:hypothetical protein
VTRDDLTDLTERRFRDFAEWDTRRSSPLYTRLCELVADSLAAAEAGPLAALLAAVPERRRVPNVLLAAVQRALFDEPGDGLAAYYPSLGGDRAPDDGLARAFTEFVARHRDRITAQLAVRETQTNEVLRATQLYPAICWVRAGAGRPLGLIEVGTSAGLLLRLDHYRYVYEFDDGTRRTAGGGADGVPPLRCRVDGTTPAAFGAVVGEPPRVLSRRGLDLNPLDPADPEDRAWLRALVWPEHAERRARLDAALGYASGHPVELRAGDALDLLPAAVDAVPPDTLPCVFVSNSLGHWTPRGRELFVALVRELGARRDLVCVVKEWYHVGLGLFIGAPDEPDDSAAPPYEVLGAAVYADGRERLYRLGTAGLHGAGLTWSPAPR